MVPGICSSLVLFGAIFILDYCFLYRYRRSIGIYILFESIYDSIYLKSILTASGLCAIEIIIVKKLAFLLAKILYKQCKYFIFISREFTIICISIN